MISYTSPSLNVKAIQTYSHAYFHHLQIFHSSRVQISILSLFSVSHVKLYKRSPQEILHLLLISMLVVKHHSLHIYYYHALFFISLASFFILPFPDFTILIDFFFSHLWSLICRSFSTSCQRTKYTYPRIILTYSINYKVKTSKSLKTWLLKCTNINKLFSRDLPLKPNSQFQY